MLVLRSALPGEARAAAVAVAAASGRRPVFYEGEPPQGLGPWLWLQNRLPVLQVALAPGGRRRLSELPGYDGPMLVATGLEGSIEASGAVSQWCLPVPPADERARLWRAALGEAVFRSPGLALIDGRGRIWWPHATDTAALGDYTLGHQVVAPYDFTGAVRTGLREFAPDVVIVLGPGRTLGGAVAQSLIACGWQGLEGKADFQARNRDRPMVLSMGVDGQREQVVSG